MNWCPSWWNFQINFVTIGLVVCRDFAEKPDILCKMHLGAFIDVRSIDDVRPANGLRTKRADVGFKAKANLMYCGKQHGEPHTKGDLRMARERERKGWEGRKFDNCLTFRLAWAGFRCLLVWSGLLFHPAARDSVTADYQLSFYLTEIVENHRPAVVSTLLNQPVANLTRFHRVRPPDKTWTVLVVHPLIRLVHSASQQHAQQLSAPLRPVAGYW